MIFYLIYKSDVTLFFNIIDGKVKKRLFEYRTLCRIIPKVSIHLHQHYNVEFNILMILIHFQVLIYLNQLDHHLLLF